MDRVRTAVAATPALTALIGTNPVRCWDTQLNQGSTFPAIVVTPVSDVPLVAIVGRMPMAHARFQFTLWSINTTDGMEKLAQLHFAMKEFIDTLNLVGIPGLCSYSNVILNTRKQMFATPAPGNSQLILDAMLYYNDSL